MKKIFLRALSVIAAQAVIAATFPIAASAANSASYDMRETGIVSSVKNQNPYGMCWAYTSASCAETEFIQYNPSINLSELHTAYYGWSGGDQPIPNITDKTDKYALLNYGGSCSIVTNLWSQWIGPVTEDTLSSKDYDFIFDDKRIEEYKYLSDYHLEDAYLFDYADYSDRNYVNSKVKDFIKNGTSVEVSMFYDSDYFSDDETAIFTGRSDLNANHSVTVIGWDDNYSADNFKGSYRPNNDGAWLVKNSWGNDVGDNGFFWVSYDEPTLVDFAVYKLGSSDNYDTNYQHDSFPPSQYMSTSSDKSEYSYMANVFRAERESYIEAVSTYFTAPDTEYQIKIYTDFSDPSKLSQGKCISETNGICSDTGYFTIELDTPAFLNENEQFAVSVRLYNENEKYLIPMETCTAFIDRGNGNVVETGGFASYEQINQLTDREQSFFSFDGKNWEDVADNDFTYSETQIENIIAMAEQEYGKEKADEYRKLSQTSDLKVTFGNISLKAFGTDECKVKFSHSEKNVPLDEGITLTVSDEKKDIFYSINGGEFRDYNNPIEITSDTRITATTDFINYYEKIYTPAMAELNSITCKVGSKEFIPEKINDNSYILNLEGEKAKTVYLLISSQGKACINGNTLNNYAYSYDTPLTLSENVNVFTIETEQENRISSKITLTIYTEKAENMLGDIDGNYVIDAYDASVILSAYSMISTGSPHSLTEKQLECADYNCDGFIDALDASAVLAYYAKNATS